MQNSEFTTEDYIKYFRNRIFKTCHRFLKLLQTNAPNIILENEGRMFFRRSYDYAKIRYLAGSDALLTELAEKDELIEKAAKVPVYDVDTLIKATVRMEINRGGRLACTVNRNTVSLALPFIDCKLSLAELTDKKEAWLSDHASISWSQDRVDEYYKNLCERNENGSEKIYYRVSFLERVGLYGEYDDYMQILGAIISKKKNKTVAFNEGEFKVNHSNFADVIFSQRIDYDESDLAKIRNGIIAIKPADKNDLISRFQRLTQMYEFFFQKGEVKGFTILERDLMQTFNDINIRCFMDLNDIKSFEECLSTDYSHTYLFSDYERIANIASNGGEVINQLINSGCMLIAEVVRCLDGCAVPHDELINAACRSFITIISIYYNTNCEMGEITFMFLKYLGYFIYSYIIDKNK